MGVKPENVFVGGNSSLQLMYFLVGIGYTFGFPESERPWSQVDHPKFLCPVPGYDRHFRITEEFGIDMINVPMTPDGPDMDMVEKLAAEDPSIKGIWCVPQYSNPDGYTYSDETVRRFAAMKTAAPDFKIFWDEAYIVHHLTDEIIETPVLLEESKKYGSEDRVFMFTSTSKITFPGAGVSALACSDNMMKYVCKRFEVMIISYDKMNQLRHVRFLKNKAGVLAHMLKHRRRLVPCFDAVKTTFAQKLTPLRRYRPLDQPQGRLLYQPVCDARLRKAGGPAVQGGRPGADRCRRVLPLRQGPGGFPPAHRAHLSQPERSGAGVRAADRLCPACRGGKAAGGCGITHPAALYGRVRRHPGRCKRCPGFGPAERDGAGQAADTPQYRITAPRLARAKFWRYV